MNFKYLIMMMALAPITSSFGQSIAVTGTGSFNSLNLINNFNAAIANVTESYKSGGTPTFVVSASSLNGGLKNGTSVIPYTVTYSCTGSTSTPRTITTTDQTIGTRFDPPVNSSCTGTISISFSGTPAANLYQGTYTDTVTFNYKKNGTTISTASLVLTSQVVGVSISLTISGNSTSSSLPLSTAQTDLLVGTAAETSNSNTGYKILVRSTNAGKLKNGVNILAYTLKYGVSTALSPTVSDAVVMTVPAGYYPSNSSNIRISYSPPGALAQGTYTDVLTFTIAAQ